MSRHDDSITLKQMLEHVEEAVVLCKGRKSPTLRKTVYSFSPCLRLVEIVGEAATRVSAPMQAAHPEILWR